MIFRPASETHRNTRLKDAMRETANQQLTSAWGEILMGSYQSNPEIASACLRLYGRYVSWIDINLVVNENFMSALYQFLGTAPLQAAACDCLCEIVAKGMLPADKLNLIQALNVTSVLNSFNGDDEETTERVAKLVNVLGLELCRCWDDSGSAPSMRKTSHDLLQLVFPFLVRYLGSEHGETSNHLGPYLSAFTSLMKAKVKQDQGVSDAMKENLLALLRTIIFKMKYDEEEDFSFGEEAGGAEGEFSELRQNLKKIFDAIGSIDLPLCLSVVTSVVGTTFDKYGSNPSSVSWPDAELALHLVYLCGESTQGPSQFSIGQGAAMTLAPLGEMLAKMVTSNISQYPHVAIPYGFFENVTRYPAFLELCPQYLPSVLEAFVDQRGLHNPVNHIRTRAYYLFRGLVHSLKSNLSPFVETVLNAIQDLLVVSLPAPAKPVSEDDYTNLPFDSQLYLYEAVGMLISLETLTVEKQAELLTAVLAPLMMQIEEIMQNELYKRDVAPDNIVFTLQLNHLIRAIGNISKGFPDVDHAAKAAQGVPPWVSVFQQALSAIATVLERLHESELIRNAARFAFQRMVGCMGHDILNHVGPLVTAGLLTNSTRSELIDFFPFIILITHKFKPAITPIMNELIGPLLERVYSSLNQPVEGTDDALSLQELRRGYLNVLAQIFNSDMESILVSEVNMGRFTTVLQSVLHFVKDGSDPTSQKIAFNVLSKCVVSWGAGPKALPPKDPISVNGKMNKSGSASSITTPSTFNANKAKSLSTMAPKTSLPGFDRFIYESILPVLFEVPLASSFDPKDGMSYLVMTEISSLHKTLYNAQGPDYIEYLGNSYLPSIRCRPESAQLFLNKLQQLDSKGLRVVLAEFLSELKRELR
ncbi:pre-tRNA nuclear export protein [Thoreauomyces humboldtii]|nr:pre-tRNA nuclear export protein [Thoreauomyces humboldtii]